VLGNFVGGDHVLWLLFGLSFRVSKLEVEGTEKDRDGELLGHIDKSFAEADTLATEERCECEWTTNTTIRSLEPLT